MSENEHGPRLRPDFSSLSRGNATVERFLEISVGRVLEKVCLGRANWNSYVSDEELQHVADWLHSAVSANESWLGKLDDERRPKKLMKFHSIEQIVKEADKCIVKAAQRLRTIKTIPGDEELFAELGEGYYVLRLLSPSALDRESSEMQHCIGLGGYDKQLKSKDVVFLSLRDSAGKAHATLEIKGKRVVQLSGKQNKLPIKRYLDVLKEFIAESGFQISNSIAAFRQVVDSQGNWHDVDAIPEGVTIEGDLDLSRTHVTTLPRNLKVNGTLELAGTEITDLPIGLVVNGDLNLENSQVETLPDGLVIGGDLRLQDSKVNHLPTNMKVGGRLNIMGTAIEALPSCISIGTDLLTSQSKIRTLPDGFVVNGNLRMNRTLITNLPDDLRVSGDLEISHTKISELPRNLFVGGCLIASDTRIGRLPSDLTVKGTAFVSGTPLNEIEQGFKVGRGLHACHTHLRTLPEGFTAGGDVDLRNTPLEFLPAELRIRGKLEVCKTPLRELPETIKVSSIIFADPKLIENMDDDHPLKEKMMCQASFLGDEFPRKRPQSNWR